MLGNNTSYIITINTLITQATQPQNKYFRCNFYLDSQECELPGINLFLLLFLHDAANSVFSHKNCKEFWIKFSIEYLPLSTISILFMYICYMHLKVHVVTYQKVHVNPCFSANLRLIQSALPYLLMPSAHIFCSPDSCIMMAELYRDCWG